mgnify:CR=1 FL=1
MGGGTRGRGRRCSSGVRLFVFSDSRKKGEKKVSISYSLVGLQNVKVVKVVPYSFPRFDCFLFSGKVYRFNTRSMVMCRITPPCRHHFVIPMRRDNHFPCADSS